MLELLAVMVISFGSGYLTHWYNDEDITCRSIELEVPVEVRQPLYIKDCLKEDANTVCSEKDYPYPRYIVNIEEYTKGINHVNRTREYLNVCKELVDEYNHDKYIKD